MDIRHYTAYKDISKIKQICKPLESLGISYFTFTRHFPNNHRILLTNSHLIWDYYIQSELYDISWILGRPFESFSAEIETLETNASVFMTNQDDEIRFIEIKKFFNHRHGINFINIKSDYIDVYEFCSQNRELYFLRHDLFKRFILYFNQHTQSLLNTIIEESIYLPASKQIDFLGCLKNKHSIDDFLQQTKLKQYTVTNLDNHITLNPKDLQCIQWLIKGKTAEETAHILSVSKRTIEHRLASIKEKLNCHKTADIISYIYKNGIELLFET